MKRLITVATILGIGSVLAAAVGYAQQRASEPSLGELARQLMLERAKSGKKPFKVFTNDNLPPRPRGGAGLTVAASMSPTSETGKEAQAASAAAEGPSGAHDENYYRNAMRELRARREMHERQLAVLQQKLSQNQMQFYADPQKTLDQEFTRADVNKLTQQIEEKKQEIAADEKATEDLRDQLRREGRPPGWLR